MKLKFFVLLLWVICTCAHAQIQLKISTDKLIYHYGDEIFIRLTAYNSSSDTFKISTRSTCVSHFWIDDILVEDPEALPGSCPPSDWLVFPPESSNSWIAIYCGSYQTLLLPGSHYVYANLEGCGFSDSIYINVDLATSTNYINQDKSFTFKNFPNPFREITWITIKTDGPGTAKVSIFNTLGELICIAYNNMIEVGENLIKIDLTNEPSGLYWCQISLNNKTSIIKLLHSK